MEKDTIEMVRQIKANARRMTEDILSKQIDEQKTEIDKLIQRIANWEY